MRRPQFQTLVLSLGPSLWVGASTLAKAFSQLIVLKWIAIQFGPATLGISGQAMGLISILQTLAGGGIANGVIRQFAIEAENPERRKAFVSASFTYGLFFTGVFLLLCTTLAGPISRWAFSSPDYAWFVLLLGVSSLFSFVVSFAQALLSAQSLVRAIFWANFLGLALGLVGFLYFSERFGETGMLLGLFALIFGPAVLFAAQILHRPWFNLAHLRPRWNPTVKKELVPFTLIAAIGGTLVPIIFVILRSNIELRLGWEYAGYWQALLKISDLLFSFIALLIASTYYPRVAAAASESAAREYALRFGKPFMALLTVTLAVTGLIGPLVLTLIFSESYAFLRPELNIMLCGGFFKALGWLGAYYLMARNQLKVFLLCEAISSLALYLICRGGLEYGFRGLIWGQVVHAVFYVGLLGGAIRYVDK